MQIQVAKIGDGSTKKEHYNSCLSVNGVIFFMSLLTLKAGTNVKIVAITGTAVTIKTL